MLSKLYQIKNRAYRILVWLKGHLIYAPFFASYGRRVTIESPTLINHPEFIHIGNNVSIRKGLRLEAINKHGRTPKIVIGDHCNIEQNVHIVGHSKINIGRNVSITAHCAIVDVTHPYNCSFDEKVGAKILDEDSEVIIGDGCFIGIGSVILPNVKLGDGCIVGANSVVTKSFPNGSVIFGSPARLLKQREFI